KGRVVTSPSVNITETDVMSADGDVIGYDYLVIATGHSDLFLKTRQEKLSQYQSEYEDIRSSKSVLIVGGGPSGVELAAEIAVDFPEKKVTLVHKGPRLLEFIGEKAADKAFDWFKSKKVEVILNQSVDLNSASDGNKTYKTSGAWMVKGEMVDEHLRIKDRKNVFTIGDITSILEMKQGYIAEMHANVAVKNIKVMMSGGEKKKKMSTYKPGSEMAIVSLGRKDSVAQFPFVTVIGCLPGLIKSKDLFVGKTRKTRGLNPKCVQVWSDCWLLLMLFDVSDDVLLTSELKQPLPSAPVLEESFLLLLLASPEGSLWLISSCPPVLSPYHLRLIYDAWPDLGSYLPPA
ncbi:hypothetical protein F2Q68_00022242, partial [Brassica cretica]